MENIVFVNNRNKVLEMMDNNSILIEFNRPKPDEGIYKETYNGNRNHYYLTGVFEYENIVILQKIKNVSSEMIFINPYDEFKAKWVGAAKSKEEITKLSGIKNVRYLDTYEPMLHRLLDLVDTVYLDLGNPSLNKVLTEDEAFAKKLKEKFPWINIKNSTPLFKTARTVKSKEEVEEFKKAVEITKFGVEAILKNIGPMYEYQIESFFDQAVKFHGATGYSFPTIAASGENSCCLHYQDNNCLAKDGDLILFDLGASYNMYCADISRTFPISGKFTPRQKQLYNIVLTAQKKVFEAAKPGVTTRDLNNVVIDYYATALKEIGLISSKEEVEKYYYHGVSHHIGLDCHDLCDYTPLKAGCIISNEPGLYIKEEGIGIRIEDDVLITETGAEWLSPQIIKEVEDIENFIKENK